MEYLNKIASLLLKNEKSTEVGCNFCCCNADASRSQKHGLVSYVDFERYMQLEHWGFAEVEYSINDTQCKSNQVKCDRIRQTCITAYHTCL